jgi:hypothetical protein
MPQYWFERVTRTAESEALIIVRDGEEVGRADVHFGSDVAHATVCLPEDTTEDDIQEVIGELDERVVMTADPLREDFIVTVWVGRLAGVFSEDFESEFEEDLEGNGHLEQS